MGLMNSNDTKAGQNIFLSDVYLFCRRASTQKKIVIGALMSPISLYIRCLGGWSVCLSYASIRLLVFLLKQHNKSD